MKRLFYMLMLFICNLGLFQILTGVLHWSVLVSVIICIIVGIFARVLIVYLVDE